MKYFIFTLFSVTQINAQLLVDTFPLPYSIINNSMWGLSEFEDILYLGEDFNGNIHRMTKQGNLIDMIDVDDLIDFNHGLSYDGLFFYIAEDYTTGGARVFKLDGAGNILESFVLPPVYGGNSSGVGSLFKDGNTLWYTVYYPDFDEFPYNYAYQYDLDSKSLIDTIPLNGAQVYGFAVKGDEVIYVTDDLDGDEERIFVQNKISDEILYSFPLEDPDGDSSPRGLHWDGSYLWLLANRPGPAAFAYKMIYQYELPVVSGPSYSISIDTLDFGLIDVEQNSVQSLTLENTGNEILEITDISISEPAFTLVNTLPILIDPENTQDLEFQFDPTEAISYEGTASINSNTISNDKNILLLGEGLINSTATSLKSEKILLIPNPVTGDFIRLKGEYQMGSFKHIKVYDIQGNLKLIVQNPVNHYLEISELCNGIYYLELWDGRNEKIVFKVAIQR